MKKGWFSKSSSKESRWPEAFIFLYSSMSWSSCSSSSSEGGCVPGAAAMSNQFPHSETRTGNGVGKEPEQG